MTRSLTFASLCAALCLGGAAHLATGEPAKALSLAEVRAKYAKYPSKALKIAEPVELEKIAYFKDGGSVYFLFKDAGGKHHSFRTFQSPGAAFHYANLPNDQGAVKGRALADGGEEQKEIYGVWLRWIDKNVTNRDAFLADKELPKAKVADGASLSLSFRALERRIVEIVEGGKYGD